MKVGAMFSHNEIRGYTHYDLVAETWCNYESFDKLPFSAQRKLKEKGYDKELIESLMPYIQKCKQWALVTGAPERMLVDMDEHILWQHVINATNIICYGK